MILIVKNYHNALLSLPYDERHRIQSADVVIGLREDGDFTVVKNRYGDADLDVVTLLTAAQREAEESARNAAEHVKLLEAQRKHIETRDALEKASRVWRTSWGTDDSAT